MATEREILELISELKRLHLELDTIAEVEADRLLKAMRKAQSYTYGRTAEILAENPLASGLNFQSKIDWYASNWAEIERTAIRENGLGKALSNYVARYAELAGKAEDLLAAGGRLTDPAFARIPDEWIEYLKGRTLDHFGVLGDAAIEELDTVFLTSVLEGRSPAGMLAELKGKITGKYPWGERTGMYEWHAGTYARTQHRRCVAIWKNEKASELGMDWRLYVGPVDAKTRSFCLNHVGRVFSVEQIEEMDNGQTGNVLVDRGGWNCRHDWEPIDKGLADQILEDEALEDRVQEIFD